MSSIHGEAYSSSIVIFFARLWFKRAIARLCSKRASLLLASSSLVCFGLPFVDGMLHKVPFAYLCLCWYFLDRVVNTSRHTLHFNGDASSTWFVTI